MMTLLRSRDLTSPSLAHIICREVVEYMSIRLTMTVWNCHSHFLVLLLLPARAAYKSADAAAVRF